MKHRSPFFHITLVFLLIEFIDELIGGVREAAWPLIRTELGLSYVEIGLLLSLPGIIGSFIEPGLGIMADTGKKRAIILVGGVIFVFSSFLAAGSFHFLTLLVAYTLFFPASGAFVSLSQTVMMDLDPDRRVESMARWTFAGSFGYVLGPLLISGAAALSFGWRIPYWGVAIFAALVLALSWHAYTKWKSVFAEEKSTGISFIQGLKYTGSVLHRKDIWRWLALLELSNLMLDVFYSYLALYLVDVVDLSPASAAIGVAIWSGVGLLGDMLIIPLLERVNAISYLRSSALLKLCLFPVFLIVPWTPIKFVSLGLLGLLNAGWYSILQAQLYATLPGKSGTAMSLGSLAGIAGRLIPLALGLAAQAFGLGNAMWFLLLGPISLLVGLPFASKEQNRI